MAAYTDVLVFRRVLREARPCWPFIGGLFLLSLLASPLALLAPLPLKIAVDSVIAFIAAAATFVGVVYVMARIDWPIAVIALGISPGLIIAARVFRPRLRRQSRALKKLDSHALGIVQEILGALRVVKAFGQEGREEQRFVRRSREAMRAKLRLAGLEGTHQL